MSNTVHEDRWKAKLNSVIEQYPNYYLKEFTNFNINLSYGTLYKYAYEVARFLEQTARPIREIGFDDYSNYMAGIRKLVPAAQIVIYSALKKYSKYLFVSGKTIKDHMEFIERPNATERQSTVDKRERGFLSEEEIPQFIQNVKKGTGCRSAKNWKERDMFLIQLFLNTGLRCSGVWKLDVNDIDFENGQLTTTEKRGKVRTYPLNDDLLKLAEDWLKVRVSKADITENALFVSEKGTRLSTDRIAEIIQIYAKDIKGKHITPHKLRATYGTQVYNATKDIYLTQVAMGHKSPTTTELYIRGQVNKSVATASNIMSKLTMQNLA